MAKKLDIAERYKRSVRHSQLSGDRRVQAMWKAYLKRTKGASRMTKAQWYDFNYPKGPPKGKRTGFALLREYAGRRAIYTK